MNKKFRKLILPVSILATSHVYALGLGDLQVNSALDEVLNGQIPIIADSDEDVSNIKVSLASSDDYKRVNLDKSYVPSNIEINVVEENNKKFIVVTSNGPISEPIVSLLLSVDWANGNLLREYTILLDPPLFNTAQTQQNFSDPVQTQTYTAPVEIEAKSQSNSDVNDIQSYANSTSANSVVVENGDTLWKIAGDVNQGYGTQQQMMVALFNNNPSAFTNNDMNRLKKGSILNVPNADDVSMISNGQALAEVKTAVQNWSNLQTQSNEVNNQNSDYNVDYGIELTPPNDSDSSNSNNTTGTTRDSEIRNRNELNRLKEELAGSNLENDELSNRVAELEEIIKDQDLALNLKDNNLAQLQQQVKNSTENTLTEMTPDDSNSDDVWDQNTEDTMTDASDEMSSESMNDEMASESMNDEMASESMNDEMANESMNDEMANESMNDEMANESMNDEMADDSIVEESNSLVEEVKDTPNNIPADTKVVNEKSFMDKVLDYKFEALIGLGAIILAGLAYLFMGRRKSNQNQDEGGFLDSISNDNDEVTENSIEVNELDFDLADSDENIELDLNSNDLEDVVSSDVETIQDDLLNDLDLDITDEHLADEEINEMAPDVIVMDDQLETDDIDSETRLDEEIDLDLDLDLNDDAENLTLLNDMDLETNTDEADIELATDDEEDFSLDIEDFDMDELTLDADNDSEELELDDLSLEIEDFDMDLDEEVSKDENEIEEGLSLDLDMDLDLEDDFDLELDVDSDEIDTAKDQVEDSIDELNEHLEFDLSDDLEVSEGVEIDDMGIDLIDEDSVSIEFEENDDIDIGLDLDDIMEDDSIDTKLDLAKAYFEMGDVDGAKQMVAEIMEEGSEDQIQKAEKLNSEIEG